jgi:GH15 family glucan-1,4-alpha-glucosidase
VYRYPPQTRIKELPGEEHFQLAFLLAGRGPDTRRTGLSRKTGSRPGCCLNGCCANADHLGLYGEQTGPQDEALGNFLQAFTNLALISAAFNLDRMLGSHV